MAKNFLICDTGVLIRFFRKEQAIENEINTIGLENIAISAITAAEMYQGMKNNEERMTKELINKINVIPMDKSISDRFLSLMIAYKNHIQIPDALIAATALEYGYELYTLNIKDFSFVEGIKLYKPKQWRG
jgi:predicted nucleic acid-binding protein